MDVYQEFLAKSLTEKYSTLSSQMDKIINDANTEITNLREKLSAVHTDQKHLEQKNHELVTAYKEKSRSQQQIQKLYQSLKSQVMASHVQTAASDDAENTLQTVTGSRFIDRLGTSRAPQSQYAQFSAGHRGAEQIHSRQRSSGSGGITAQYSGPVGAYVNLDSGYGSVVGGSHQQDNVGRQPLSNLSANAYAGSGISGYGTSAGMKVRLGSIVTTFQTPIPPQVIFALHQHTPMAPSKTNLPAIRACLFDMDGLLIDSEDWYTVCTNEVLREYGKPDLPWDIKAQLQGRPGPEAGKIFSEWAQLPISRADFMTKSVALQRKYFPRTQPLPGVRALLSTPQAAHTHIALATSSHAGNFGLKTGHLTDLFAAFPEDNRVLGDDPRIPPGRGKPAPDIYLLALETVNARLWRDGGVERDITPAECLVFEDSVPGVEAGRRAGMQVVWCPHPGLLNEYRGREKEVLAGLTGQHKDEDEGLKTADKAGDTVGGKEERTGERVKGAPGEIDDGWAVLLQTLEGFPYERYGIGVANKL
ncbi:hypothetical protein LTR04_000450 [Oleoguttula sp. CCFEE 6159]|nr:hypothetical protein LTR04_000450 [Oleoguttula sp. CCFEE 6159]